VGVSVPREHTCQSGERAEALRSTCGRGTRYCTWRMARFQAHLTTGLLRSGVSPKVVSKILGHSDVQITLNVYDHPEIENFREPLTAVADQLLRDVTKSDEVVQ